MDGWKNVNGVMRTPRGKGQQGQYRTTIVQVNYVLWFKCEAEIYLIGGTHGIMLFFLANDNSKLMTNLITSRKLAQKVNIYNIRHCGNVDS